MSKNGEKTPEKKLIPSEQTLPSSLTKKSKNYLLKKLSDFNDDKKIEKALLELALSNVQFPDEMHKDLLHLQAAYQQHKDNEKIEANLRQAIETYLNEQGLDKFKQLLKEENKDWHSNFLIALAGKLKLDLQEDILVKVAIKDGKLLWQVFQGEKILYDPQEKKYQKKTDFTDLKTWEMTWEHFCHFKKSGKRSGNNSITKEIFKKYFKNKAYQDHMEVIWDELKEKGILDKNNRLSSAWRASTNFKLVLDALFTVEDVMDSFEKLGNDKTDKQKFIDHWKTPYKGSAGILWDKLSTKGILKKTQLSKNDLTKIDACIREGTIHYAHIEKALFGIANKKEYYEKKYEEEENTSLFRKERSVKSWKGTGLVENSEPTNEEYCTKLWDVGIYKELAGHRNTEDEKQLNHDKKLNYDHIPSKVLVDKKATMSLKKCHKEVEKLEEEKFSLDQINKKMTKISSEEIESKTEKLEGKIQEQKCQIKILNTEKKLDKNNKKNKSEVAGNFWWTIAIPEELHRQGETFMQQKKEQEKSEEHPFYSNLLVYLSILEKRSKDFFLTIDDYLNFLGATRYLYRCQLKQPEKLDGEYKVGIAPQYFFSKEEDRKKIDGLFDRGIKHFLEKKEGISMSAKKELKF